MKRFFLEWVAPILAAILLSIIIKRYVFTIATVPTASMKPTILEGNKLFVTRVYNPENLKIGDVVVFYFR